MSFCCHHFDQNSNENIVRISALKFFKSSLVLPRSFWGLPVGFLTYYVPRKPKKLQGSPVKATKKIQGRNPEIISLVFWKKLLFHKDILRLTDLYCCHSCSLSCYCCGCLQAREQEQGGLPTTMEDRSTARVQQGIAVQCGLFFNKVVNKRAIAHCNIL